MKSALFAFSLLVVGSAGCRACHDDHPYVPYRIESSDAAGGPVAGDAGPGALRPVPDDAGADPFAAAPSVEAPPGLQHWSIDGVTLDAPDGLVFARAMVGDFTGDGSNEAFAVVQPPDGVEPGELLFYRPGAAGAAAEAGGASDGGDALLVSDTFAPPAQLARDAGCTRVGRLVSPGPRTVLVELGVSCPQPTSAPSRYVALVEGGAHATLRLAATLADPPGAPTLTVDAAIDDRDHDGRPDVALRLTLQGGGAPLEPGPQVSATIAWLDRPAGLSRDSGTTESSFGALARDVLAKAAHMPDAAAVPGAAGQIRALWRATCAEGGSPRLTAVAGTGTIVCNVPKALEEVGLAEARAYATLGDPLRAALALDRAERPPAARTPERVTDALKWIAPLAPVSTARLLRFAAAVPVAPPGRGPSWGALAFEPSGKLLIRTRAGVVRFDADLGDEASAGVADWNPAVSSPDGAARWVEAYDPCDGLPVRATFELAGGSDLRDVALPVQPLLSGRCSGSRGAPARVLPIAWGAPGLEAIVDDAPLLFGADLMGASPLSAFLEEPVSQGAPRSPDGKAYVIPTGAGLLVRSGTLARLYRSSEIEGAYGDQRDCAISNDLTHVACVSGGRVWAGTWDAPSASR